MARNVGPACRWTPPAIAPQFKPCRRCFLVLPVSSFGALPHTRDRLTSWCVPCHRSAVEAKRGDYQRRYREQKAEAIRARDKARYQPRPLLTKPCARCGELFTPLERNQQRHCSRDCARNPDRPSTPKRLRLKVLERDGWMCYLCGNAIPEWLEWPHQLAGTADHVIPWKHGGKATLDNLRAAHWHCNRAKWDRVPEAA